MSRRHSVRIAGLALLAGLAAAQEARAVEDAAGFYLLGSKGSMAGFVPPPGIYVTDYNLYYAGEAKGDAATGIALRRLGGRIDLQAEVEVDAQAYVNAPTATWIAPQTVLGGNVGFGIIVPVGWKDVDVDLDVTATLTLPPPLDITLQRSRRFGFGDDTTAFGDPVPTALIGWHHGNWHWNLSTLLNVPIGQWSESKIANMGFNRWALDTNGAVTWLSPTGLEASAAAGFTFNWENPDTDYDSGTEFHVEFALMKHFSKTFALGLVGYHYDQVSGDSGPGATLGPFEGRVTALGPSLTYGFNLGKIPVSTELKWLHEFDVRNRAEGDSGFLIISMPLSVFGS